MIKDLTYNNYKSRENWKILENFGKAYEKIMTFRAFATQAKNHSNISTFFLDSSGKLKIGAMGKRGMDNGKKASENTKIYYREA